MKLLELADIDDFQWQGGSGRADVLLALGDMADAVILQAAEDWHCPVVLAVKGNHDTDVHFPSPIVDLHLRTVELGGFSFGGLNGCWQYKPRLLLHGHQHQNCETLVAHTRVVGIFGWQVIEI